MSLRHFLRSLLQNEQLIQKLSETYPIRRAAQLTAFFLQKGKEKVEEIKESEAVERFNEAAREGMNNADRKKDESLKQATRFFENFLSEFEKEWENEKKKLGSGASKNTDKDSKDNQR